MGMTQWLKEWLEKHPSLITFNIDLSQLKSIKFLSDVNINSCNVVNNANDRKTLELRVNPKTIKDFPEELTAIKELMKLSVPNAGGLLESGTDQLFSDVTTFQSDKDNIEILENLRSKLPIADIPIWEAALYIKKVYESGRHVTNLKNSIKDRYGDRGRNIANLCTTGYLDEIILPIYDELSTRPGFMQEEFNTQYEVIVMQYPFAVFVARSTPDGEALREITSKINYNKAYGIHSLNIHSIGDDNAKKVLSVIEDKEIVALFTNQPRIIRDGNVLLVVVYF